MNKKNKVNRHGEKSRLARQLRVNSPLVSGLVAGSAPGSELKSAFLELYKDYLRIKSGFLPRSGCL